MTSDVECFLERFTRFGAEPSVATYVALFHPDATLFDSGMPRPLTVPEIPEHIEGILKLVPDFRMTPERWRFREPTIFIEASNRATLAGAPIEWPSIYCIDLRDDHVLRGRRYYDRRPLFAKLAGASGAAPARSLRSLRQTGWRPWRLPARSLRSLRRNGDYDVSGTSERVPDAPLSIAALRRLVPDLAPRLLTTAGDDALLFREWELGGTLDGAPVRFGVADRFDLEAGRVSAARAYFDTVALATS